MYLLVSSPGARNRLFVRKRIRSLGARRYTLVLPPQKKKKKKRNLNLKQQMLSAKILFYLFGKLVNIDRSRATRTPFGSFDRVLLDDAIDASTGQTRSRY